MKKQGNEYYTLAIDPGNEQTGYCLLSPSLYPIKFAKKENEEVVLDILDILCNTNFRPIQVPIEHIECFGMPAGKTLFETAYFIGRLTEIVSRSAEVYRIYRHEEKMCLCHSMKANDATIKQALVDRFAPNEPNHGKGSKKKQGYFYGFKADVWSAFAIGVTFRDKWKTKKGKIEGE